MEIQIRKTKITKAIFSQMQMASTSQIISYAVLGWVVCKGEWIILYKDNVPVKYRLFRNVTLDLDTLDLKVDVTFGHIPLHYKGDKDELVTLARMLRTIKHQALDLGQFFL